MEIPMDSIALVSYTDGQPTSDASEASANSYPPLQTGDEVKLSTLGFGKVGAGVVVDATLEGQWLGVDIFLEARPLILVRPRCISEEAQISPLWPSQRGIQSLTDAIDKTVLWIASDVRKPLGEPEVELSPFVPQNEWIGLEVHLRNSEGVTEASERINCWSPDDPFQHGTLGEDYVGVTVLDVFLGDNESIMTHSRWPLCSSFFPTRNSLKETISHFASIPVPVDPLAYLGGMLKAPYRFIIRQRREFDKVSLLVRKTQESEIRKVNSEDCCIRHCCQFIPQERTLMIRTRFYLKLFDERREYAICSVGQIHNFDGNGHLRVITLERMEVCIPAWYIIHGVSKSAYHTYAGMYREGVISGDHGNKGVKRPRVGTVQATGSMKSIIEESANQMPHHMHGIGHGRMDTLKYLPAGNNWKRVCSDANELNVDYGLPTVSQSTISRIKREHFNNVAIKPVGSSFAKCTECDDLQQFILKSPKGSSEYVEFVKQRSEHLNHQASCRRIYASWREESKRNPQEILCIIHDKMDTKKTALPRMRVTTKATAGLGQIPMSVTGMVAHGHADGAYAHYAPSTWPMDSSFTISSLARLLRRLEGPPLQETGDFFPYPPANPLFEALMRGKSQCKDDFTLVDPSARHGARPLPKYLYLQLDNSAKDNKNQYLMAFLSLLTARGIFKEIQVGFLLVGHTHEDIDAYFSHLSKALKSKNTFVLADLMKTFMHSQELSFMPEVIQEVADFKSYLKDYLNSGTSTLIGLGEMHLFKFYVDNEGVPIMTYKKSAVDTQWLPSDRPPLCLWKKDSTGRPLLPSGCPMAVPFKPIWGCEVPSSTGNQEKAVDAARKAIVNKNFILVGIEKYIQYWRQGMSTCEGFAAAFGPYVEYWNRVLRELKNPLPNCPSELVEGFWPQHNWRLADVGVERQLSIVNPLDVIPKPDDEPEPYCGPANEAPQQSYNPWRDIRPGSWVLLRPDDPSVCEVWQGRALSTVRTEDEHENNGKFLLQYWRPDNSAATLELRYTNCWYGRWVVEETDPTWVDAHCIVFSNWSRTVAPKSRRIPQKSREATLINLNRANAVDP